MQRSAKWSLYNSLSSTSDSGFGSGSGSGSGPGSGAPPPAPVPAASPGGGVPAQRRKALSRALPSPSPSRSASQPSQPKRRRSDSKPVSAAKYAQLEAARAAKAALRKKRKAEGKESGNGKRESRAAKEMAVSAIAQTAKSEARKRRRSTSETSMPSVSSDSDSDSDESEPEAGSSASGYAYAQPALKRQKTAAQAAEPTPPKVRIAKAIEWEAEKRAARRSVVDTLEWGQFCEHCVLPWVKGACPECTIEAPPRVVFTEENFDNVLAIEPVRGGVEPLYEVIFPVDALRNCSKFQSKATKRALRTAKSNIEEARQRHADEVAAGKVTLNNSSMYEFLEEVMFAETQRRMAMMSREIDGTTRKRRKPPRRLRRSAANNVAGCSVLDRLEAMAELKLAPTREAIAEGVANLPLPPIDDDEIAVALANVHANLPCSRACANERRRRCSKCARCVHVAPKSPLSRRLCPACRLAAHPTSAMSAIIDLRTTTYIA